MRKGFFIGLVSLVSLAIVQPATAQRPSHGGRGGGAWHGGGHHRGVRHVHHSRASFGFHFFLPLSPWYFAPYPYYSYAPYYYYPAPPAYSYVPPAPEVGYLYLQVEPADAHIYVNGRYLGPVQQFAGGAAALAPGSHQVAVVAWGHRPFQQEVHLVAGQAATMRVTLQPDPAAPVAPPSPRSGSY